MQVLWSYGNTEEEGFGIYDFVDVETGVEWTKTVARMKRKFNSISSLAECRVWLNNAYRFRAEWGDELVPRDARRNINEVERRLNVNETVWPNFTADQTL